MPFSLPINRADTDLGAFGPDDPYFFERDNVPIYKARDNDVVIATQLEWTMTNDCEVVVFVAENPAVEVGFGGMHVCRTGGTIIAVRISCTQPGSPGSFDFDLNMNGAGNTVYTNTADRPTLAYNSPNGWTDSILPAVTVVPQNATLVAQLRAVQGGTPRWFRAEVWIQKPAVSS
jgi:hypothetical protein